MKDPRNLAIVALVAAAAFLLGSTARERHAHAQGYPGGTADSNGRMIAVTGTIGSGVSVLWLVDTVDRQLAVYQCRGGKSIELVAARKIEWDLKIEEFRDESIHSPEYLRKLYRRDRGGGSGGIKTPDEKQDDKEGKGPTESGSSAPKGEKEGD
jgi:hypothetical protein